MACEFRVIVSPCGLPVCRAFWYDTAWVQKPRPWRVPNCANSCDAAQWSSCMMGHCSSQVQFSWSVCDGGSDDPQPLQKLPLVEWVSWSHTGEHVDVSGCDIVGSCKLLRSSMWPAGDRHTDSICGPLAVPVYSNQESPSVPLQDGVHRTKKACGMDHPGLHQSIESSACGSPF